METQLHGKISKCNLPNFELNLYFNYQEASNVLYKKCNISVAPKSDSAGSIKGHSGFLPETMGPSKAKAVSYQKRWAHPSQKKIFFMFLQ